MMGIFLEYITIHGQSIYPKVGQVKDFLFKAILTKCHFGTFSPDRPMLAQKPPKWPKTSVLGHLGVRSKMSPLGISSILRQIKIRFNLSYLSLNPVLENC